MHPRLVISQEMRKPCSFISVVRVADEPQVFPDLKNCDLTSRKGIDCRVRLLIFYYGSALAVRP